MPAQTTQINSMRHWSLHAFESSRPAMRRTQRGSFQKKNPKVLFALGFLVLA